MAGRYSVAWTEESKTQVDNILKYLRDNWSEKECKDFLDILYHFEQTISAFPKSFKESKKYKGCRLILPYLRGLKKRLVQILWLQPPVLLYKWRWVMPWPFACLNAGDFQLLILQNIIRVVHWESGFTLRWLI